MREMKFPKWTPQWVIDEYRAEPDGYHPVFAEIAASPHSRKIWETLGRRSGTHSTGLSLALTIVTSVALMQSDERLDGETVKNKSAKIKKLATALAKELRHIDAVKCFSPFFPLKMALPLPTIINNLDDLAAEGEKIRPPRIYKSKNTNRLRFMRTVRKFFQRELGSPLHECNLALTSIFFDCSTLTPSHVDTLTKGRRRKPQAMA